MKSRNTDCHIQNKILQKITGLSAEQLFLRSFGPDDLSWIQAKYYYEYLAQVQTWKPLEYILESAEFYGLDFFVNEYVLIPRNDTEIMVDVALETRWDIYIDVWTGSGCIPISVLKNTHHNFHHTYALDISLSALKVAHTNIQNHHIEHDIELVHSDLLEKILKKDIRDTKIVITANLPYIKQDDFEHIDKSVYTHEPDSALYWWDHTGFELYGRLIWQCLQLTQLWNTITLLIEIGFDQKEICEQYMQQHQLTYNIFSDRWGIERCVRIDVSRVT